jgi:glycosidase
MKKMKELVNTAHKKGIKILLDFVSHHVHQEHPWWKKHPDWFGTLDLPDGRKNLRLWDEYRLTTWFEPYIPSFDFTKSKAALKAMSENAIWWLEQTGADGFRHDAVKHVPNEFWRVLTAKIKKHFTGKRDIEVYQIGETFGDYAMISSYVNNGQLNAQFNFNLFDVAIVAFIDKNASLELIATEMEKTAEVYGPLHVMGNIMDSHDKIRYMAYADGDLAINDGRAAEIGWENPPKVDNLSSFDKLKLYYAYMLTIPGLPVIYYGSEFGMTGASDPDNRRMMYFDDKLNQNEKKTLDDVSKLINLRKKHSALRYGDVLTVLASHNQLGYIRSDVNERILVLLNKSEKEEVVTVHIPQYYEIGYAENPLTKERIILENNQIKVKLAPSGYEIFILDK